MRMLKCLFTVLFLLCATVASAQEFEVGGICYNITDTANKTVKVTSRTNRYTGSVMVPESVVYNGATYNVTSIGSSAFAYCTGLTSIEIPNSVTSIGYEAFYACSSLASIEIPCSVTSIGDGAFRYCSGLTSIIIPNSVTNIGSSAFSGCSGLTSIVIPNGVTSIGYGAFYNCTGLTSIEIPNSVTTVGENAFFGCTALVKAHISNSVTSIGRFAFKGCLALKSVSLSGCISVGTEAFYGCSALEDIGLYDNVESIGSAAFDNTAWLDNRPDGIVRIGKVIYKYKGTMPGKTHITISDDVKQIGYKAFYGCGTLVSVTLGKGVNRIEEYAFGGGCGIKKMTIPANVTYIGNWAFSGSFNEFIIEDADTKLHLGNCVFEDGIGGGIFANCVVRNVYFGRNVGYATYHNNTASPFAVRQDIGSRYSPVNKVIFGARVTNIQDYFFEDCSSLTSVISNIPASDVFSFSAYGDKFTPENLTLYVPVGAKEVYAATDGWNRFGNIEEMAEVDGVYYAISSDESNEAEVIAYNSVANSIVIPEKIEVQGKQYTVTRIKENAFSGCSSLENITLPNSIKVIGDDAFANTLWYNSQPDGVLYLGEILYKYKGTMPQNTSVVVKDGTLSISGNAFEGCTGLVDVTIPGSVTSIGAYALSGCSNLVSVEIPDGVTTIEEGTFNYCSALASVTIPDGVTKICDKAFYNCYSLTSIGIPGNVVSIGKEAFYNCKPVSVSIPGGVATIGSDAFMNCSSLNAVHINDVASWCGIDFANYTANPLYYAQNLYLNGDLVTELVIFDSVTSIGNYAFPNCKNLASVIMGNGVASIGDCAFFDCDTLASITIGESVESIGVSAFYNCDDIESLVIPGSVTSIGNDAFRGCKSLKELRLEDGTETLSLGYYSYSSYTNYGLFYDCPLETLYLGRNLSYKTDSKYGYSPFYDKGTLTSLTIGNCVTSIGSQAFDNCDGLTSIVIPNSVTSIGNYAFSGCYNLKTVYNFSNLNISKGSSSNGNVAYNATYVLNAPNGEFVGDYVFSTANNQYSLMAYIGKDCRITLPSKYKDSDYNIGAKAFENNTQIVKLVIPAGVKSISNSAFYGCTELKEIINLSNLSITTGSTSNGYVAYYADEVLAIPSGDVVGDYIFKSQYGVNTLVKCLGDDNVIKRFDDSDSSVSYTFTAEAGNTLTFKFDGYYSWIDVRLYKDGYGDVFYENRYSSDTFSYTFAAPGTYTLDVNCEVHWEYENEGYSRISDINLLASESVELVLPDDYKGSTYVIGNELLKDCIILSKITIPAGVTSIGYDAFYGCTNLKTVENYSNMTFTPGSTGYGYVAYYADNVFNAPNATFEGDFVFAVINGVKTLVKYTSDVSNEIDLVLPEKDGGYAIAADVFKERNLGNLTIPACVTSIGKYAFSNCTNLTTVTSLVPAEKLFAIGRSVFSGVDKDSCILYIPYGAKETYASTTGWNEFTNIVELEPADAVRGTCGADVTWIFSNGILTIRGTGAMQYYKVAPWNDFKNDIKKVVIEYGITNIADAAFMGCENLLDVVIPNSVEIIGTQAFDDCYALADVAIPSSVTSIGEWAFASCKSLESIVVDESNSVYDSRDNCNAIIETATNTLVLGSKNTTIPDGIVTIGSGAFDCCAGLKCVTIPSSVTAIRNGAFAYCDSLTSIEIPGSVTNIGSNAFIACSSLVDIVFNSGLERIDMGAFANCVALTKVELPDGLKYIGGSSFAWCTQLADFVIPATVENIGEYLFDGCSALRSVTSYIAADDLFEVDFISGWNGYPGNDVTLYVPAGTKAVYASTNGWNEFANIEELGFTAVVDVFNEVKTEKAKMETIYDLNGRVVKNPKSGVYLIDGKKVLIK